MRIQSAQPILVSLLTAMSLSFTLATAPVLAKDSLELKQTETSTPKQQQEASLLPAMEFGPIQEYPLPQELTKPEHATQPQERSDNPLLHQLSVYGI